MPTSRARKPASSGERRCPTSQTSPASRPAGASRHPRRAGHHRPRRRRPDLGARPADHRGTDDHHPRGERRRGRRHPLVENADGPLGDITVTKVRSAARDPDPYIGERARRGRFLIVTVSVKATGDGFDINPFDFYARERGGRHVEEQCCADFGEELESLTLNEGEKTDGVLVFDIRPGKASLVYAPNFDEEPIGEWELS
jgi:hypothetical protein